MNIISISSGGKNIVGRPQALASFYPSITVPAAVAEVYWRYEDEPPSAARLIGRYLPGQQVTLPFNPVGDKNIYIGVISISAAGVRSASDLRDAEWTLITFQRETEAPTVSQIGAATHTLITLAIGNFSQFANRRRVRLADDSGMTTNLDEQIIEVTAGQILPRVLYLNRPDPGTGARTIYVRISHSSGGDFGAESAATAFTWTDNVGAGGTSGSGDGTGGDTLPCFSGNVKVKTPAGFVSFDDLSKHTRPFPFAIVNETGTHQAELIVHWFKGKMIDMGGGELVTFEHMMKVGGVNAANVGRAATWLRAQVYFRLQDRVNFEGNVFNLHVLSSDPDDLHYVLENGEVPHNVKPEG